MISVTYHSYVRWKLRISRVYFVFSFYCPHNNKISFIIFSDKQIYNDSVDYLGKVGIQNVCTNLPAFEIYSHQITHFH